MRGIQMSRLEEIRERAEKATKVDEFYALATVDIPYLLSLVERAREALKLGRQELELDARHGCKDAQTAIKAIDKLLEELSK